MNEREVLSVKRIEASPQIAQMGVSNPVYFFSGSILPKHTDTASALPIIASILLKEKKNIVPASSAYEGAPDSGYITIY